MPFGHYIVDSAANPIASELIRSDYNLKVAMSQEIGISTLNSSVANLAAAASFTGTAESTLGASGVRVSLFSDQKCIIQVQHSSDGTNWDFVDSWRSQASVGEAKTTPLKGTYFRVVVTNNGASTTTSLRLQTTLPPVMVSATNSGAHAVESFEKPSYRACSSAAFIPVASTVGSLRGSSTKIIRVQRCGVVYSCATGSANFLDITLTKLSAFTTPGTKATITAAPMDSLAAAATGVAEQYTASSSGQTSVGTIDNQRITQVTPAATIVAEPSSEFTFGNSVNGVSPVILRGTGEWLHIAIAGTLATTPLAWVWFEWTEE